MNRAKTSTRWKWTAIAAVACFACGARSGLFEGQKPGSPTDSSAAGAPNRNDATSGAPATSGGKGPAAGSAGVAPGKPALTPLPLNEVCPIAARESCTRDLSCPGSSSRGLEHLEQCVADHVCGLSSELLAALKTGVLEYDPLAAAACRAHFDADPCVPEFINVYPGGVYSWLDACPGALLGHRVEGEACHSGAECEAGLYCELNGVCPGTCTKRIPIGASCSFGGPCESGTHCLTLDYWDPNSKSRCVYEGQPGESCDPLCTSDQCTFGGDCQSPNWCNPETRRCAEPNGLGEPCGTLDVGAVYVSCAAPLFCDRKPHSGLGQCQLQSEVGGPCQYAWSTDCLPALICDVETIPTEGTPTGKCIVPPVAGEACTQAGKCAPDSTCNNGVCQAPRSDGQSCNQTSECGPKSWCADWVCRPIPYPGEACVVSQGQAACAFGRCIAGICSERAQAGEACSEPGDCAAGADCKDGLCAPQDRCGSIAFKF